MRRTSPVLWGILLLTPIVIAQPVFDGDHDGVPDERDLCLFTPVGEAVMANGCARSGDADQDGVDDSLDRCPRSPAGAITDSEGCSLDEDLDGVADGIDQCAGTPFGYRVDAIGCTSGQTPSAALARRAPVASGPQPTAMPGPVAAAAQAEPEPIPIGTPPPEPPSREKQEAAMDLDRGIRIRFRRFSSLLDDEALATLQTFAARAIPVLENSDDARIIVTGATSANETGSAAHRLGVGRALTVKAFLRSVGIDRNRIRTPEGAEQRVDSIGSADVRIVGP